MQEDKFWDVTKCIPFLAGIHLKCKISDDLIHLKLKLQDLVTDIELHKNDQSRSKSSFMIVEKYHTSRRHTILDLHHTYKRLLLFSCGRVKDYAHFLMIIENICIKQITISSTRLMGCWSVDSYLFACRIMFRELRPMICWL